LWEQKFAGNNLVACVCDQAAILNLEKIRTARIFFPPHSSFFIVFGRVLRLRRKKEK
jgi:hypothetical protein